MYMPRKAAKSARKQLRTISFVIPVHNEAQNAPLLYHEILKNVKALPYKFEFIYVDDGSKDFTSEAVEQLAKAHQNIRLIQLSRNFGKEAAVSAGLHAAKGDAAMILDADFQHPPRLIADFIAKWEAEGNDVVIGIRDYGKSEGWFKRFSSDMFYRLIKPIANTDIIPHASDFRLLDRRVINAFNSLGERDRMARGLIDWLGFNRAFVHFQAAERKHGERSYSYRKLVELAINSFTSYTLVPLRLAGYLGTAMVLFVGPLTAFLYAERYIFNDPFGWGVTNITMLSLFMLFLIGIVLACLGLVAMYIARIHAEVSGRPLYVIRKEVVSADPADEEVVRKELTEEMRQRLMAGAAE